MTCFTCHTQATGALPKGFELALLEQDEPKEPTPKQAKAPPRATSAAGAVGASPTPAKRKEKAAAAIERPTPPKRSRAKKERYHVSGNKSWWPGKEEARKGVTEIPLIAFSVCLPLLCCVQKTTALACSRPIYVAQLSAQAPKLSAEEVAQRQLDIRRAMGLAPPEGSPFADMLCLDGLRQLMTQS